MFKDVFTAWNIWKNEYLNICERHAPISSYKTHFKNKPWFSYELLHLARKRDYAHKVAIRLQSVSLWKEYKHHRNIFNASLKRLKKEYYTQIISKSQSDPRLMWKTLNNLLPSNKCESFTDKISPDQFNSFFSTIGQNLTSDFGDIVLPHFVVPHCDENFDFLEVNVNFTLRELLKLPMRTNLDGIDMDPKLLKLSAPAIAPSLTHIFNLSLYHGLIPSDWKVARITPIYKRKGLKSDASNYRPISIVPTISKIIEKSVKSQIMTHLISNNLLSPSQSAYLPKHSTQTALHYIIDTCMQNIDKGFINLVCCLDLSKGFDVLNHDLLLHKLSKYYITHHSIKWFKSYLSNRYQFVTLEQTRKSSLIKIPLVFPKEPSLDPFFSSFI